MAVSKVLIGVLVAVGVVGAGVFAYEVAKPRVHPIKQADFEKLAARRPDPIAPVTPPNTSLFGEARVIDGDTLLLQDVEAHLWTIEAPELAQTCEDKDGKPWACGEASRANLEKLIGGRTVACRPQGEQPRNGRWEGVCFVTVAPCLSDTGDCESDLNSLNLAQVTQGWAADFEGQYMDSEADAKEHKLGIWAGRFEEPAQWRKRQEQGS